MNKFALWVHSQDKKQRSMAQKIGISTSTLHEILRKDRLPSLQVAYEIEKYTDGAITIYDWLDQPKKKIEKTKKTIKIKRKDQTRNSESLLKPSHNSLKQENIGNLTNF